MTTELERSLRSQIFNDAFLVRYYERGGRSGIGQLRRRQAIQKLGETLRFAFNETQNYESIITTVLDALRPDDRPKF